MHRLVPLLMPLTALYFVGLLVAGTLSARTGPAPDDEAVTAASATAAAEPEATSVLREPGNVCQGTVRRPEPGQPGQFAPQYTRRQTALGITIVGTENVDERAFAVAERTIEHMFAGKEHLSGPLVAEGAYIIITEAGQGVLDLPEFACLAGTAGSSIYDHVCGVADRADHPVVTVNELDMVGDRRGPCGGLNILYHELGHLVHGWVLGQADYIEVRILYQSALDAGKYKEAYARRNAHEYFAEATQAYFLSVNRSGTRDRDWIKRYDPGIFELLERVYGP